MKFSLIPLSVTTIMLTGTLAWAQTPPTLELTGTLRDFRQSHPDFENHYNWHFPLVTGIVKDELGADGLPVLNGTTVTNADDPLDKAIIYVTFNQNPGATSVYVESSKDLSNVVLKLVNPDDPTDTTAYKYDNLDVGTAGNFPVPAEYAGMTIEGVWVKSGCNASGDGPGYGEFFYIPADGQSGPTLVLDPQWRIESPESFKQWFTNTPGINQSIKHTIVLEDPDGDGIYRFERSKHNGQSFFPIDDQLFGNEGNSHNYHFTYQIHTKFTYTDPAGREPMIFRFSGDDDVWVFINRKLVIDLGGVHPEKSSSVNVDAIADQLGLEPGKTYDFDFFFAERHTVESNFTIETTIQFLSPLYD